MSAPDTRADDRGVPRPARDRAVDQRPARLQYGLLRTTHYLPVDLDCVMGAENNAKTVVHMHGALVPEMFDGYPEATFLPGSEAT